jgi:hypothetical protein
MQMAEVINLNDGSSGLCKFAFECARNNRRIGKEQ